MPVQDVVQTATQVLTGQVSPREAVTILSTMTRDALPEARRLRVEEPSKADDYRQLLLTMGRELRGRERDSADPKHLKAVTDDLAALYRELGEPDGQ